MQSLAPKLNNQTALAVSALTDLMYQIFCLDNDMPIYAPNHSNAPEYRVMYDLSHHDYEYSVAFLVSQSFEWISVRGADDKAFLYLKDWILEVFENQSVRSCAKNQYLKSIEWKHAKALWEASFVREVREREFIADPLVPKGNVHYRYVYRYDSSRQFYNSYRVTVVDEHDDFWKENVYWFDYFGPEENELGLIRYLDY